MPEEEDAVAETDGEDDVPADLDEDLAAEDLVDGLDTDDALDEDTLVTDGPLADDAVADDAVADDAEETADAAATDRPTRASTATGADDDDDQPDPDDVEADLDTILKDRIAAGDDEDEEEEEEKPSRVKKKGAEEETTESGTRVAPRKPGEFVCSSCFLVKPDMQLADRKKKLCLDCV